MARILVADGYPGIRDFFRTALFREGYDVVTACDGQEALEKLREDGFDLVITELEMPRCGGDKLLMILRSEHVPVPVILYSSLADNEVAGLRAQGFAHVLKKGISYDELIESIVNVLQAHRA